MRKGQREGRKGLSKINEEAMKGMRGRVRNKE